MSSQQQPGLADGFLLIEADQMSGLAIRTKNPQARMLYGGDTELIDDEPELVSRPPSVRSLSSRSPSLSSVVDDDEFGEPEQTLAAERQGSLATISQGSNALPLRPHPKRVPAEGGVVEKGLPDHYTPAAPSVFARGRVTSPISGKQAVSTTANLPSRSHITHADIDRQIMGLLVEHACRVRFQMDFGRATPDQDRLRQLMIARFRSLPIDHPVVKEAMKQAEYSSYSYVRQCQTLQGRKDIYANMFTDIERSALIALSILHRRFFNDTCDFCDIIIPGAHHQSPTHSSREALDVGIELARSAQESYFKAIDLADVGGVLQYLTPETVQQVNRAAAVENTVTFDANASLLNTMANLRDASSSQLSSVERTRLENIRQGLATATSSTWWADGQLLWSPHHMKRACIALDLPGSRGLRERDLRLKRYAPEDDDGKDTSRELDRRAKRCSMPAAYPSQIFPDLNNVVKLSPMSRQQDSVLRDPNSRPHSSQPVDFQARLRASQSNSGIQNTKTIAVTDSCNPAFLPGKADASLSLPSVPFDGEDSRGRRKVTPDYERQEQNRIVAIQHRSPQILGSKQQPTQPSDITGIPANPMASLVTDSTASQPWSSQASAGRRACSDYQMQLILLEQQNRKRLLAAKVPTSPTATLRMIDSEFIPRLKCIFSEDACRNCPKTFARMNDLIRHCYNVHNYTLSEGEIQATRQCGSQVKCSSLDDTKSSTLDPLETFDRTVKRPASDCQTLETQAHDTFQIRRNLVTAPATCASDLAESKVNDQNGQFRVNDWDSRLQELYKVRFPAETPVSCDPEKVEANLLKLREEYAARAQQRVIDKNIQTAPTRCYIQSGYEANFSTTPIVAPPPMASVQHNHEVVWDDSGVPWATFYHRDHATKGIVSYTFRCDIESVDVSELGGDFIEQQSIFPRNFDSDSRSADDPFYTASEIAYAIAKLNPLLRIKPEGVNRELLKNCAFHYGILSRNGHLDSQYHRPSIRKNSAGVPWLRFKHSLFGREETHTVRCDIDNIKLEPPSPPFQYLFNEISWKLTMLDASLQSRQALLSHATANYMHAKGLDVSSLKGADVAQISPLSEMRQTLPSPFNGRDLPLPSSQNTTGQQECSSKSPSQMTRFQKPNEIALPVEGVEGAGGRTSAEHDYQVQLELLEAQCRKRADMARQ